MARIGALIPIRLDSTRLPQKALQDVAGLPAVQRLITQVAASGCVTRDRIIICTTERAQDDPLVATVARLGVRLFRGSTDDLIDRMYRAAAAEAVDVLLQVDGDDICADAQYMTACVDAVVRGDADVACVEPGLPLGAASKAFRFDCLETVFRCYVPGQNDTGFSYYLTRSGMFKVAQIPLMAEDHRLPDFRLTLDYPEDLELFRALFQRLRGGRDAAVGIGEICSLARLAPELQQLTAGLDETYWSRTRQIMAQHPLKLQIGTETVTLEID